MNSNKIKKTPEEIIFNIIALTLCTLFALACILPILYTVSGSFTSNIAISDGLKLIPAEFSLEGYKMIFMAPERMIQAYWITILLVIFGTALGLLVTTITAYVLYRKDFRYRSFVSFFFFFTTLFSGGAVPGYVLTCALNLRDTFLVLLLSGFFSVMNMIIMRTYFTGNVPLSLVESAKIDGADDFRIYWNIVLPAATPILATVGLLTALGYWNNWSTARIYISTPELYPLQYYLYKVFDSAQLQRQLAEIGQADLATLPTETYKMAMTVFTMGPVVLFYPFVQKYFVSGVTIGAVKG